MGRVAVITGASRGMGAATALVLAERGFRVVVNYLSSAERARRGGRGGRRGSAVMEAVAIGPVARAPRPMMWPQWSAKPNSGGAGSTCSRTTH